MGWNGNGMIITRFSLLNHTKSGNPMDRTEDLGLSERTVQSTKFSAQSKRWG